MGVFHELFLPFAGENSDTMAIKGKGVDIVVEGSEVFELESVLMDFLQDIGDLNLGRSLTFQRRDWGERFDVHFDMGKERKVSGSGGNRRHGNDED